MCVFIKGYRLHPSCPYENVVIGSIRNPSCPYEDVGRDSRVCIMEWIMRMWEGTPGVSGLGSPVMWIRWPLD